MKRGRQSRAEWELTDTLVVDVSRQMPPPPVPELNDAQQQVWRSIAGAMPGRWLQRGAYAVLAELCRRICRSGYLEQQIQSFQSEWLSAEGGLERFDKLLAAADRESKAILALSRALRLTPQSQMHPRDAGRRLADLPPDDEAAPWDVSPRRRLPVKGSD